jgi:hypothetical protein
MEFNKTNRDGHMISGEHINTLLTDACEYGVTGTGRNYMSTSRGGKWEVMYDGTAGAGGGTGWEVSSPAMEMDEDGECAELRRGCDTLLRDLAPKISSNCGLHVHVDVSDFDWKEVQKLLGLWVRYEPFFFSMVPNSRAHNTYCRPMRAATWDEAYRVDQHQGYAAATALNATTRRQFEDACRGLGKFKTLRMDMWMSNGRVEFRMHSSTVTYTKIREWVRLLLSLVGRVKTSTLRTTSRLPVRVRALSRPTGFGPSYVLGAIGMGPMAADNAVNAATREVFDRLMQWIPERQRKFSRGRRN